MPSILFNLTKLQEHNLQNLIKSLGKIPNTNNTLGIVLIIDSNIYNKLMKNDQKIKFLNSNFFINNIQKHYYIFYNKKKKIIEIRDYTLHIEEILHSILLYTSKNVTIWTGPINKQHMELYLKNGFESPYITNKSPLGYEFQTGVSFYRKNKPVEKVDLISTKNVLEYIEEQYNNTHCILYAKFTPDTIKYLYKLNKPSITIKDKNIHNKELAGTLLVNKVTKINGQIIFELSGNPSSVKPGLEDEVKAVLGRYNFHTHPKKAYVNYGVKNGWPSSHDYVGFLKLKNNTIFHSVITLEGIYIISLRPEWINKIHTIEEKYILENYEIDHNEKLTFDEYIDLINNKKYKEHTPVFFVKFIKWDERILKPFPIFYKKTDNNCLATDKAFDNYKKFYK